MFFKKKAKKPLSMSSIVKGIIIGGAVGSVLGVTLAPKSGKETRAIIKEQSIKAYDSGKSFIKKGSIKAPGSSFFRGLRALLFGKKKQ